MHTASPPLADSGTSPFSPWASGGLAGAIAGIYLIEWSISRHATGLPEIDLLAWAVTADLVLIVPLLVYALGIRRLGWSRLTLMPAFIVGLIAANLFVPAAKDGLLGDLEILFAPLELALVGVIAWKARAGWRQLKASRSASDHDPDLRSSLEHSAQDVLGSGLAAALVASEMVMFSYASRWRQPAAEPTTGRFTLHRQSGVGLLMGGLILATAAEIVPIHFVVHYFWSPIAAWILTLLSIYGGIWILGHWQAVRQRPCELSEDALELRLGLLWDVRIPYQDIASVRRVPPSEGRVRDALSLVPAGLPSHCLELAELHTAHGPYGVTQQVDRIALFVDDSQRFEEELEARRGGSTQGSNSQK